jgi:eukaryotic-like serine/threonine-protein kinase
VQHELGRGAASVVCAAYDSDLARTIALKVLRARGDAGDERRLREGRALARLSHPNVLKVYEVGRDDNWLYIALEHVDGVTFRQWSAVERRSWRAICDAFCAAARGLSALHRAGMVHRDVKPDNLLIDRDGGVKVVDLGLVGAGVGAGTPRYMAPELRDSGAADAASDQFALTVSLAECLGGSDAVPRRVRRVLDRGMAKDPKARFGDLEAWAAALAKRPRRLAWFAAASTGVAALATVGVLSFAGGESEPSCESGTPAIWNAQTGRAIAWSFGAVARPHVAEIATRTIAQLQNRAEQWRSERVGVCKAYHERHEIMAARFDRQVACLDRMRRTFELAVERLRAADAGAVDHAIEVVLAVPDVELCRNDERLARAEPMPDEPGARAEVIRIEDQLSDVQMADKAGDPKAALAGAREALVAARRNGRQQLIGRAAQLIAEQLMRTGDMTGALAHADEAVKAAAAARDDEVESRAWLVQLYLRGVIQHQRGSDLDMARRAALAAADRAGDERTRAALEHTLGLVAKSEGDYAGARDHFRAALAHLGKVGGETSDAAATLSALSMVLGHLGDLEGARAAAEDGVRRDLAMFGPHHPRYAIQLRNLANRLAELGDLKGAATRLEEALAVVHESDGDDSLPALAVRLSMANIYGQLDRLDDAETHVARALVLSERLLGTEHPDTASVVLTAANIAAARGDLAGAERHGLRALEMFQKSLGPNHPMAADVMLNLGGWVMERGDGIAAERYFRAALASKLAAGERGDVAAIRSGLGEALLLQRRHREALVELEAGVTQSEQVVADPADLADARFALARGLWQTGAQRRAVALARQAYTVFVAGGAPTASLAKHVREWADREKVPLDAAE